MVKEKLIIDGVDIPIDKGISTVLTFSIKDIQQPDKVKSSFSKTIKLPGSKAINDKLNFIFEVNSDSTFNPNLKLDATYFQNDIAVFSGFIQLKDIHKKDYNQVEYSVVLFGETANIFRELGNKFLNDAGMNWQELDHDYTRVNQENSWDTSYILNGVVTPFALSGYVYPMINYGNDTDINVYNVNEMFPAVYAKEYIDRMFADSGFTYTSNFFNASLFRHLIIPFNGKEFSPPQSELLARTIEADTPLFVSSGLDNYTLKINPTFGPLKFDKPNLAVIHLMIYDIYNHRRHVLASPFTCFDWERSATVVGPSLKKIFPVGMLQFRDFMEVRRSMENYIVDLANNVISYREYDFEGDDVVEIKKNKELDERHQGEYAYHIVRNLVANYLKLCNNKNDSYSNNQIKQCLILTS